MNMVLMETEGLGLHSKETRGDTHCSINKTLFEV